MGIEQSAAPRADEEQSTPSRAKEQPSPERLLLLDTCGAEASVALAERGRLLELSTMPGRSASEQLLPTLAALLQRHGWQVRSLTAVAVIRGPGSFTGVRVGVGVAKALVEGTGATLLALSRLDVLIQKGVAAAAEGALAVLQAGREELFWVFAGKGAIHKEEGVSSWGSVLDQARRARLALVCEQTEVERLGSLADEAGVSLIAVAPLTAADALELALSRWQAGAFDDPLLLDALYLHRTEAETLERQRRHRLMKLAAV